MPFNRKWTVAIRLLACLLLIVGCSRASSPRRVSESVTARFVITQFPEPSQRHLGVVTLKGVGDFTKRRVKYTMMSRSGKPIIERMEFEDITYTRWAGEKEWSKSDYSGPLKAVGMIRDRLVSSPQPLGYLRSVAHDVNRKGVETVRGRKTRHYAGTIDLFGEAVRKVYIFPVDVWIDDSDRVVRYEYHPIGSEELLRWEFFNYRLPVNLTPPPPDKTLE